MKRPSIGGTLKALRMPNFTGVQLSELQACLDPHGGHPTKDHPCAAAALNLLITIPIKRQATLSEPIQPPYPPLLRTVCHNAKNIDDCENST